MEKMMFKEIGKLFNSNGFTIIYAMLLLLIMYDPKAIHRVKEKKTKTLILISIILYLISFISETIRIVLSIS